jgi:hypothetical protein
MLLTIARPRPALAWEVLNRHFGDHDAASTLLWVAVLGYREQLVEVERSLRSHMLSLLATPGARQRSRSFARLSSVRTHPVLYLMLGATVVHAGGHDPGFGQIGMFC